MQKAYIPVLVIPAAKFKWFLASWYTCILKSNIHIKGTKIKHKKNNVNYPFPTNLIKYDKELQNKEHQVIVNLSYIE